MLFLYGGIRLLPWLTTPIFRHTNRLPVSVLLQRRYLHVLCNRTNRTHRYELADLYAVAHTATLLHASAIAWIPTLFVYVMHWSHLHWPASLPYMGVVTSLVVTHDVDASQLEWGSAVFAALLLLCYRWHLTPRPRTAVRSIPRRRHAQVRDIRNNPLVRSRGSPTYLRRMVRIVMPRPSQYVHPAHSHVSTRSAAVSTCYVSVRLAPTRKVIRIPMSPNDTFFALKIAVAKACHGTVCYCN